MKGAKTISHDNDRLQMYMPKAITSFHGALDELESDIVRLSVGLDYGVFILI